MSDNVNGPAHYNAGSIECIDAIESALTPEEFRGYLKGNIFKYIWRERHTGGAESVAKAGWYQNRLQNQGKKSERPLTPYTPRVVNAADFPPVQAYSDQGTGGEWKQLELPLS